MRAVDTDRAPSSGSEIAHSSSSAPSTLLRSSQRPDREQHRRRTLGPGREARLHGRGGAGGSVDEPDVECGTGPQRSERRSVVAGDVQPRGAGLRHGRSHHPAVDEPVEHRADRAGGRRRDGVDVGIDPAEPGRGDRLRLLERGARRAHRHDHVGDRDELGEAGDGAHARRLGPAPRRVRPTRADPDAVAGAGRRQRRPHRPGVQEPDDHTVDHDPRRVVRRNRSCRAPP